VTPEELIRAWLRGLDEEEAGRTLLALGVPPEQLAAASADLRVGRRPKLLHWQLTEPQLRHRSERDPRELIRLVPDEGTWRLAVSAPGSPAAIVSRLLGARDVKSAFVAVDRPRGSLRRRPWRWPMRIGLLGFDSVAADELRSSIEQDATIARLVDIRRLEDQPGSVDLLIVPGAISEAASELSRVRPITNAILTLGDQLESWPLLEAHHAAARAATSAVASAAAGPHPLPQMVSDLIYASSHGEPFDLALTTAARGDLLLFAEDDAMTRASLPETARSMANELRRTGVLLPQAPSEEVAAASAELEAAAAGAFTGESQEATRIAAAVRRAESTIEALPEERWCQAYVGRDRQNILRQGRNPVFVFVGPDEPDALRSGAPIDEGRLPWEEEQAEKFRLTVLFVPLADESPAQQDEIELPRIGRSQEAEFVFEIPDSGSDREWAARIVVLFRNRALQTAVLSGRLGESARLHQVAALVPTLTALDERLAFDVSLVANHTNGLAKLIRHSDGHTFVNSMASLPPITERIAEDLARAVRLRSQRQGLRSARARELLVSLAKRGRDLFSELERQLGSVAGASRIQLVTASGGWFLPIEILYARYSPDDDARICERYLSDPTTCSGECTPVTDRSVVCPNAFWGLSKTIERHHFDPALDRELQQQHLLLAVGEHSRREPLKLTRTLLGASQRVKPADRSKTLAALGPGATVVMSWDEWEAAVKAADTELLVLVPHTDWNDTALEIANDKLTRDRIERTLVTGDRKGVQPVVVLFGCRTTGRATDPAGFASRFMIKGAAAVFHSSTDLLNFHASELARRLAGQLISPSRNTELLSDALAAFRRDAVHDGLIAALSISAFGDADWRI